MNFEYTPEFIAEMKKIIDGEHIRIPDNMSLLDYILSLETDIKDYDLENDSLFISKRGVQLETSIDRDNIILDVGVDNTLTGVEILHASRKIEISKSDAGKK